MYCETTGNNNYSLQNLDVIHLQLILEALSELKQNRYNNPEKDLKERNALLSVYNSIEMELKPLTCESPKSTSHVS